ncbi:MAG: hypothetical protein P4M11_02390 [Candidatus Pacebacteria bacterium]|nr:hypothetical protein [Candidatus Paceibacterota bacterium]
MTPSFEALNTVSPREDRFAAAHRKLRPREGKHHAHYSSVRQLEDEEPRPFPPESQRSISHSRYPSCELEYSFCDM